ncbi:MAG: peptidylprolyl isomerase, partial [Sphingobacteriales bacterium]
VGDSAVISMSIDSMRTAMTKRGQLVPPFLEKRKKLIYEVVMVSIKSDSVIRKEREVQAQGQQTIDEQKLQEYFTKNNLQPTRAASGLYYVMSAPGSGNTPKPGQAVTVNYTGKTIDGTTFDTNLDPQFGHAEPFTFVIGQGQVIQGWDEGVAMMRKGGKAKLFVPSGLAYGPNSPAPTVPPNSILIFDVEVLKIEDAESPVAAPAAPAVQ